MMMSSLRGRGGIFISYRREETAGQAGRLYDHLSDHFGEDRVFMDIDSIAIGTDFTKAVIEAVSGCSILLALIGRHWSAITDTKGIRRIDYPHDFVRVEIESALQRDIRVVPVLIDGAALPQANDLPPSLRPLVRRQAVELSHTGFRSQVSRLVAAVDEVLGVGPGRSGETPKIAARGAVAQQGRWRLELLADEPKKKTFRLSSGREIHDITLKYSSFVRGAIEVDGQVVKRPTGLKSMQPFSLTALSSALGSDVTIQYADTWTSPMHARLTLFILKIGDEILKYEP
jgi:hypothetical protein